VLRNLQHTLATHVVSNGAIGSIALLACLGFAIGLLLVPGAVWAGGGKGKFCSRTASMAFNACGSEIRDDRSMPRPARFIPRRVSRAGPHCRRFS